MSEILQPPQADQVLITHPDGPFHVFVGNHSRDPRDPFLNVDHILSELGYPLELRDGATDYHGRSCDDMVRALVPSEDARLKYNELSEHLVGDLIDSDTFRVIELANLGFSDRIRELVNGRPDKFYNYFPDYDMPNRTRLIPSRKVFIKRAFMHSYRVAMGVEDRLRKVSKIPQIREGLRMDREIYRKLKDEGITPLDQQAVKDVLRPIVIATFEQHPELIPQEMQ